MRATRVKKLERYANRNKPLGYSRVIGFMKFEEESYTPYQLAALEEEKRDPSLLVVQFIVK